MVGVKLDGMEVLEMELQRLNRIRFDAIEKKQLTEILNRARQTGGTPVDTGELRMSSSTSQHEMGYTKEYAPHVEYGHRTLGGGFVKGQHFLSDNVEKQRPIYQEDLLRAIRKG